MMDITEALSVWVVSLWAEYPTANEWKAWADARIAKADFPEDWLIKLSLAKDRQQALDALLSGVDAITIWNEQQLLDAGIGFHWMRYESSRCDLKRCLRDAGTFADQFDPSVECEDIFWLLNQMDEGRNVEVEARELFEPYRRLAERKWRSLMRFETPSN